MEPVLYDTIRQLEATNWWFVGMRAIARSLLQDLPRFRRAVDVGCGTGGNLALLSEVADEVVAVDLSPRALAYTRERLRDGEHISALIGGDAQQLPLADGSVDLVWLFNVIEHLPQDATAMDEVRRVLRPGGWAVVATSASMLLWSDHDVANHHQRRYSAEALRRLIEGAGLRVQRLTHANAALFAPTAVVAAAHRLRAKVWKRPPYRRNVIEVRPAVDRVLRGCLEAEARWLRAANLPLGVSLFALVHKQ